MSLQIIRYYMLPLGRKLSLRNARTILSDAKMHLHVRAFTHPFNLTYSEFLLCRSWINSSDCYQPPTDCSSFDVLDIEIVIQGVQGAVFRGKRRKKKTLRKLFSSSFCLSRLIGNLLNRDLFISREGYFIHLFYEIIKEKENVGRIGRIRKGKVKVEESRDNNQLNS